MSSVSIQISDITDMRTDAIVNAANTWLAEGGGVCGAIFAAADRARLRAECRAIGHCATGDAVLTNGCGLPARYIIHAVGPVWRGGKYGEPEQLSSCYAKALDLAAEHGIRSIAFPLLSAGIFGYPRDLAWQCALQACRDWFRAHPEQDIAVTFAVLDEAIREAGQREWDRQERESR